MQNFYKKIRSELLRGKSIISCTDVFTGVKSFVENGDLGYNGNMFCESYSPFPQLILCGAGHVSYALCPMAAALGFDVTVIDDRPEYSNKKRFPKARSLWCAPFDSALVNIKRSPNTYFAILTRDHAHDAQCLKSALSGDYAYVGMIGSTRKNELVFDSLLAQGVDSKQLQNVYAPIGLNIGAKSPREIAISILAQLISVRGTVNNSETIDGDLLSALCHDKVAALATLIEKEGSAPRGTGAKLALLRDGTFIGTVGGGLAEAKVMQAARLKKPNTAPQVLDFDMTTTDIESGKPICGGKIKILLEAITN